MKLPYEDCNCPRCVAARGHRARRSCAQCGRLPARRLSPWCSETCSALHRTARRATIARQRRALAR